MVVNTHLQSEGGVVNLDMEKKVFDRELFVKEGSRGGKIGSKRLKEKYGAQYFNHLSKFGVAARKRKRDVVE